jgi:choline dehydrogenase-like flavoprotein
MNGPGSDANLRDTLTPALSRREREEEATLALPDVADVVIVGSGIGGACMAYGLAGSGARVVVLERGERLGDHPAARDARAIFQQGVFRPDETWRDARGARFNPGNYYYVGGNSKFYGAVLLRLRARDFEVIEHADGVSPA